MMKRSILLTIFIITVYFGQAQYFQTGQDPASIRWQQINTKNFQLIYPVYFEKQAQTLASYLEKIYEYGSYSLRHNPAKMPVILHTQTVKSNGLVAWAPRRSEFYTTPHQDIYPQDWLKQLSLHEFRHIVQVDKVNSHIPRLLKIVFGEQITALVFGGYLPWWLIEGDAVVTETALSNYGRGRFPSFLMEHRAQLIEKGVFSYDKAYLGSYRDFVPNHYKLGYYLVGNSRARYGAELWDKVLTFTGKKPLYLTPVNKVLKDMTGLNKVQLYKSVFDSLKNVWTKMDNEYDPLPYKIISPKSNIYKIYKYNHWINDSIIISLKTSYKEISSFVTLKQDKSENKICIPGSIFNESAGFHDDWIIWSEQIPDIRWEHSGKSLLRMFNTKTKRKIEIDTDFKSFSPAISPDGSEVLTVETDFSNNYYLSVYSIPEGNLISRFQTPDNNYFLSPQWLNNDSVAVILLTAHGKRIAGVDLNSENSEILIEKDLGDIKQLRVAEKQLYFISSYSGKNSLYKIDLNNLSIARIFESRFGVESPAISPDGKKIILSDYTSDGYRLIQISANHRKIVPLSKIDKGKYPLAEELADQEAVIPILQDNSTSNYLSTKYKKISNLFNFHSWAPLYIDANKYKIFPGASLMSQNKLGTSETILGYKWDLSENTGRFLANYSYKGWYPVFDLNLGLGNRASEYTLIKSTTNTQGEVIKRDTTKQRFMWRESTVTAGIKLPMNFTKGAFYRLLQPEIHYDFNNYKHRPSTPEKFYSGSYHSLIYRLYFHQLLRQSYQDIYPDFGLIIDGTFRHLLNQSGRKNYLSAGQSLFYFPGLMKNHGIKIYAGIQHKKNKSGPGFSDVVRYSRGWGRISTTGISTLGVDYKLPLAYPDNNFFGLLYLRRIVTSLFADYTHLKGNFNSEGKITGEFTEDISSVGTEITADVNFLRFYAPCEIGFRSSYLPENRKMIFQFLFSIDFTSL
jgi:hypothetical protein